MSARLADRTVVAETGDDDQYVNGGTAHIESSVATTTAAIDPALLPLLRLLAQVARRVVAEKIARGDWSSSSTRTLEAGASTAPPPDPEEYPS